MAKIFQEFYCTKSGGGCGKYFTIRLNTALNYVVEIVCPACGHKHQRCIENGIIKEFGRFDNKPKEEICPPKSSISDTPISIKMTKAYEIRDSVVITKPEDISESKKIGKTFLRDRFLELFGCKK